MSEGGVVIGTMFGWIMMKEEDDWKKKEESEDTEKIKNKREK